MRGSKDRKDLDVRGEKEKSRYKTGLLRSSSIVRSAFEFFFFISRCWIQLGGGRGIQ